MEEHIANQGNTAQADFDTLMREKDFQSEFDRRVSRALETARGKWAQETRQKLEQACAEARATGGEEIAQEFAQRESQLAERERQLTLREMRSNTESALRERRLPAELAAVMHYESAEQLNEGLDALEQAFRNAVQAGVEQRLRGKTPQAARKAASGDETDAEYYRTHCR